MRTLTLDECMNTYGGCRICNTGTGFGNIFATSLTIRDSLYKS